MLKLTQPGEASSNDYGLLTLVASLPVDGGYAINTFAGPTRIDALSGLRFSNLLDAAEVYRDIREGGLADMSFEDIAEVVRQRLVATATELRGRAGHESRVDELDNALDIVEALAFTSTLQERTFAVLRDEFAAGLDRDRAARPAVAA